MNRGQYVDEYRKNAVNSASPLQLVIMLYDGAIHSMELAKAAIASGDLFTQNAQLQKAQRIVAELTSCLDMKEGGEIAQNLFGLYGYVYNCLVEANLGDDASKIDASLTVMTNLRESWSEIERNQRENSGGQQLAS